MERLQAAEDQWRMTMPLTRDMTHTPTKSLMRMLGPKGNPQARNLFDVIAHFQRPEGLHFELSLKV